MRNFAFKLNINIKVFFYVLFQLLLKLELSLNLLGQAFKTSNDIF